MFLQRRLRYIEPNFAEKSFKTKTLQAYVSFQKCRETYKPSNQAPSPEWKKKSSTKSRHLHSEDVFIEHIHDIVPLAYEVPLAKSSVLIYFFVKNILYILVTYYLLVKLPSWHHNPDLGRNQPIPVLFIIYKLFHKM